MFLLVVSMLFSSPDGRVNLKRMSSPTGALGGLDSSHLLFCTSNHLTAVGSCQRWGRIGANVSFKAKSDGCIVFSYDYIANTRALASFISQIQALDLMSRIACANPVLILYFDIAMDLDKLVFINLSTSVCGSALVCGLNNLPRHQHTPFSLR